MADFDDLVRDAVRYSIDLEVKCSVDDDGDRRVRVTLKWDGREIASAEDYFDGTGAKEHKP